MHPFARHAESSPASHAWRNSAALQSTSRGMPRPMQYMVARSVQASARAASHAFRKSFIARSSFGATPSPRRYALPTCSHAEASPPSHPRSSVAAASFSSRGTPDALGLHRSERGARPRLARRHAGVRHRQHRARDCVGRVVAPRPRDRQVRAAHDAPAVARHRVERLRAVVVDRKPEALAVQHAEVVARRPVPGGARLVEEASRVRRVGCRLQRELMHQRERRARRRVALLAPVVALAGARVPARLERIGREGQLLVDAAHLVDALGAGVADAVRRVGDGATDRLGLGSRGWHVGALRAGGTHDPEEGDEEQRISRSRAHAPGYSTARTRRVQRPAVSIAQRTAARLVARLLRLAARDRSPRRCPRPRSPRSDRPCRPRCGWRSRSRGRRSSTT